MGVTKKCVNLIANESQLGYYRAITLGVLKMYRDNSLIPRETIKMAALGALIGRNRSYDDVASEVRSFISRIVGPSLELMGTSIELLKLEGLIETVDQDGQSQTELLQLSVAGLEELKEYLRSNLKAGGSELNRLVIALKLRFIDILSEDEKREQLSAIKEMYINERKRLEDLKSQPSWTTGLLSESIELDLSIANKRIEWCDKKINTKK